MKNLTAKEQMIVTLYIVDACVKIAEEEQEDFQDVLVDYILANVANESFSELVCKNIKILKDKDFISGTVEVEDTSNSDAENDIEVSYEELCNFENISITGNGELLMMLSELKYADVPMESETENDPKAKFKKNAYSAFKFVVAECSSFALQMALTTAGRSLGLPI